MNRTRVIYLSIFATLFVMTLFVINSAYATTVSNFDPKLSRDADAARWQALGEAYAGLNLRARQADAARWQAMGEYYSKQLASISHFDPKLSRDIDAARWQALGEAYAGLNLRARQADAARWQAMGEYYVSSQR
jgi:hypothetical protein